MNRQLLRQPATRIASLLFPALALLLVPSRADAGVPPNPTPTDESSSPSALSSAADDLEERSVSGPAGGYAIHLRGRFRSRMVATIGPNGRLVVRCVEPRHATDEAAVTTVKREERHAN